MATDYPDWTSQVNITGSDVTIDVDIIQQSVGNINVDIAAQSAGDITVDISAQSIGNIDVNLAASDITVIVTVTGTAQIDIETQSVGIYLQPGWAALQGTDKNFYLGGNSIAVNGEASADYVVPAGKTLFICGCSFIGWGHAAADRDKMQICALELKDVTEIAHFVMLGANGGAGLALSKPVVVPSEHTLSFLLYNLSNHVMDIYGTFWGFEV